MYYNIIYSNTKRVSDARGKMKMRTVFINHQKALALTVTAIVIIIFWNVVRIMTGTGGWGVVTILFGNSATWGDTSNQFIDRHRNKGSSKTFLFVSHIHFQIMCWHEMFLKQAGCRTATFHAILSCSSVWYCNLLITWSSHPVHSSLAQSTEDRNKSTSGMKCPRETENCLLVIILKMTILCGFSL